MNWSKIEDKAPPKGQLIVAKLVGGQMIVCRGEGDNRKRLDSLPDWCVIFKEWIAIPEPQ